MTAKKKSSSEKAAFRREEEPTLQASALSAIESALIPHLPETEISPSFDLLGKIPISLKAEDPISLETYTSPESPPMPQDFLSETSYKIHNLSSHSTTPALDEVSSTSRDLQVTQVHAPLHTKYPYWAAIIAALVWLTTLGTFFWDQNNPSQEGILSQFLSFAHMSIAGIERISWLIFPPLFFFLCAVLYTRSQGIKRATEMMNVMVARLSQPEHLAMDSVATLSQAVRREVAAIGDGVERALARVGEFETMIRTEIGMLERAYADGEQRIHMLVDKLALQKEEVLLTTENLCTSVGDLHKSLAQDLEDTRGSLVVSLSEHIDSARTALQTTSKDVSQVMSTQVEETSNQLKNMSEMLFVSLGVRCADINQQLAETAQRVETDLLSHTDKLSDQFSEKCNEVYSYMSQQALDLTEKWDAVGKKIFTTIEEGVETARINLQIVAEKSASSLDEKTTDLCNALITHTRESQDALVATGKDVVTAMASQTGRIHENLTQYAESISTVLKDRGTELDNRMEERLITLKGLLEERATTVLDDFKTHLTTLHETLEVQGGGLNTAVGDYVGRLEKTIHHDGTSLLTRVENLTTEFSSGINGSIGKATELFSDHGEKIMHTFEGKVRVIGEMLSNHFATFESGAEAQVTSFVHSTESLFHRLHGDISTHFSRSSQSLQEDIDAKAATVSELFSANEQKLRQALSEKAQHLEQASSEANAHLQETLETAASAFERSLRYRGIEITDAVAEHTKHFEETVSGQLMTFNTNFQDRTLGFEASFRDTSRFLDGVLDEHLSSIASVFDSRGTELVENFQKQSDILAKEIIHIGEAIVHTLESRAASISDILRECCASLTSLMARSAETLQETIDATATRSVSQLVTTNQHIQEDVSRVSHSLSEASLTLKAIVTETRTDLTDVEKALSEQTRVLTSLLSRLSQETDASSQQLRTKIDELKETTQGALGGTDALINKLDSQGHSIASFSRQHAENIMESVQHLENIGVKMTHALNARKDSLETALTNVLERTDSITSVTETLDGDLRRHCATMEETLNHLNEVLTHGARNAMDSLKHHYDLLYSLAIEGSAQSNQDLAHMREQIVNDINNVFSETLEKFHAVSGTIQEIASSIHNNLEGAHLHLQRSLLDFPQAIEEPLNHATAALSESTQNAMDSLKQQYDLLHSLAREGSIQSTEDLTHMRKQITNDLNGIFAQSLEKFQDVARAIQEIASSIHNNLEGTHVQLQNSLLNLPDVCEQTSAAMRRVIGDQVKALDALNALVKRASSGGSGAVLSEADREVLTHLSRIKEPQSSRPSSQPVLSSSFSLHVPAEREMSPTQGAQRKEFSHVTSMPPPAGASWSLGSARKENSPPPKASPSPAEPRQEAASDKRGVRAHLALLNTLARDIPKIVDSQRIDEAWTGYHRGEPNAFTEALYTPHGQHVFRDVSRRYHENHDFRQTVSHYIEEFENLLESSGVDASSPTRRAYLTSDTGKMYTFLAHLSGRL